MSTRQLLAPLLLVLAACDGPGGADAGMELDGGGADASASDASADAAARAGAPAPTELDEGYAPDDDPDLANPERGIYYWDPTPSDPHTLVAEWLYLGAVCDADLTWAGVDDSSSSRVLVDYARALEAHRAAGRKVVFRPRYDTPSSEGETNGCGLFEADTDARMRAHVVAVAAMLADVIDVVAFVEAGWLGRWGEWNHADHAPSTSPVLVDPDARRAFLRHVLDTYAAAGVDRHVELRRPLFAREQIDADATAHVGLYNDCFMTTDSDYGTYSNFEPGNPSNFDGSAEARAWAESFSATAPFGGETCPTGDGTERWRDCDRMVGPASEPASLHMSYLHGGYALDARATWEAGGCYDEIRRRLGYRFEVRSVRWAPRATAGQPVEVTITVANTGWAILHHAREARLVLRGDEPFSVGAPLDGYAALDGALSASDARTWRPGEEVTVRASFVAPAAGDYTLHVVLPDPDRPDVTAYAIRFATLREGAPLFDPSTGENALGLTMRVDP